MSGATPQQAEATAAGLIVEIERYLAAVDLFRREGCEPEWRSGEELGAHGGLCQPSRRRIIRAEAGGR